MKNKPTYRIALAIFVLGGSLACMSYISEVFQQAKPWVAPASASATINPLKGNTESVAAGKKIYVQLCVACHGEKGKGDGIAGANLTPRPADHSLPKFQNQSDGVIFWKITTGRAPMASYEKILTATQRWQVVNYLRTLSASAKHS